MDFKPTALPGSEAKRIRSLARHLGKFIDWTIQAEVAALDAIIAKL